MTPDITPPEGFKFTEVSCSQCGNTFGPGDHGFSHCSDHNAPPDSGQKGRETGTPRTQELLNRELSGEPIKIGDWTTFARTLERELNEANKNASEWSDLVTQYLQVAADAKAELAAKDALIGELRDAASIYRQAAINAGTDLRAYSHDKECGRYHAIVIGELDEKHQSALRRAEQGKEGEGES